MEYPKELTPALRDVLGMMVFELSPIAPALRAAGHDIERRAEEWQMAVSLRDMLRHLMGGDRKPESAFKSEKEAYDFCRQVYNESGGVAPELRRAYEFYQKNYDDGCDPTLSLDVR